MSSQSAFIQSLSKVLDNPKFDFNQSGNEIAYRSGKVLSDFFKKEFVENFPNTDWEKLHPRPLGSDTERDEALKICGPEYVLACDFTRYLHMIMNSNSEGELKQAISDSLDFLGSSFQIDEHELDRLNFELKKTIDSFLKETDPHVESKEKGEGRDNVIRMEFKRK